MSQLCTAEEQALEAFKHRVRDVLTALGAVSHVSIMIIPLMVQVIVLEMQSRRALRLIRKHWQKCTSECFPPACITDHHESLKNIRDCYVKLSGLTPNVPILRLASKPIEDSMIAWDDLVEDITVACDPEFKVLVDQIARVCQ